MHSGGFWSQLLARAGTATRHAQKSATFTKLGWERWTEVQQGRVSPRGGVENTNSPSDQFVWWIQNERVAEAS